MTLYPSQLKTEYAVNPLGIDRLQPRLFWMLESAGRSQTQFAYQVLVSTSIEDLNQDIGHLWDSGKVLSNQSNHVCYGGEPLETNYRYAWKVRVWDGADQASPWSEIAYWTMGLPEQEWTGKWICNQRQEETDLQPSPYIRTEFAVSKPIHRAIAYATALGVYELHLNGSKVGADWFAPGWTDYHTRVQYQSYDVTEWLSSGMNAIGAILGTGWYAGQVGMMKVHTYGAQPYFKLQLIVEYSDGTLDTLVSDGNWKTSTGPILYSDMIRGEAYDARLELKGWNRAGFDHSEWEQATEGQPKCGKLVAQVDPPVRVMEERLPESMKKSPNGTYIYDMGQNMVGWVRLEATGIAGQEVTVSYAEMLNPDGTLYTENLRKAVQSEHYRLSGEGVEGLEPHFTFHGFRYVEVAGLTESATLFTIIGKVVYSAIEPTGKLETSDAKINRLQQNIVWGQKGNFLSVPTDCPQRDERLGWTGDAQIFARTACFNADVARFFSKFMVDMLDAQMPNGAFTDVAPEGGWWEFKTTTSQLSWMAPDNAGWGDAGVIIPWTIYQTYGDTEILTSSYDAMVKWVEYLQENSDHLIRPDYANYGDWLSIHADTPKDVLATAYFAYSADLLSKISAVLGKEADERKYRKLFEAICEAFQKTYIDREGRIKGETQTVYVLALWMNLLTKEQRPLILNHLLLDIRKNGNHLTTGFLGVGYLLPALTAEGAIHVAYELLKQESFPSWLYSVKHGATTIWERWDGWTEDNGFQTPTMNSFNHYSLGSVGEWMYRTIAGIDTDSNRAGYKHIRIHPQPGGELTWARGEYKSVYGAIRTDWRISGKHFNLQLQIPANTTATVIMPGSDVAFDLSLAPHIRITGKTNQETTIEIGSGSYLFQSKLLG